MEFCFVNVAVHAGAYFGPFDDAARLVPCQTLDAQHNLKYILIFFSKNIFPKNLEDGPEGEHLPDRLAEEIVDFIETHKDEPSHQMVRPNCLWMNSACDVGSEGIG